jgi:hypothetical protein
MTFTGRSLAGLGLTLAMVVGLVPEPARLRDLARELEKLPEVYRQMESEGQRRSFLDHYGEYVLRRVRTKEAILDALAAGRLSLFEAAAAFRAVNQRLPTGHEFNRSLAQGRSEGERYCRQVLCCLRGRRLPQQTRDKLIGRLEADLENELRRYGDVCLPAVE